MRVKVLLVAACTALVLGGCAKPPTSELEDARRRVARAGEIGAEDWSPGEYELAIRALAAAEQQVADKQYRAALRTLELVQRYADSARKETARALARVAEEEQRAEQERLAEEQRQAEQARLAEEQRQAAERERQRRQQEAAARARAEEAARQSPQEPPPPVKVDRYEVRPGQNLALIAQQPEVYDDKLLWPLIYRANRDQIKTPQEISSGQILVIPRDKNREELEAARQEARELNLF